MSVALSSGPVSDDEFAGLIAPLLPLSPVVAVAVSGGSDSMALACLMARWAQKNGVRCVPLIVEHGLREESAQEAREVAQRLAGLGLTAEILPWDHDPLHTNIHAAARAARYRLLTEACARLGARDLLIAHHRQDQAETVLLRLCRGTGITGLSGMAAALEIGAVRFLRPFLSLDKARLMATCEAANVVFVTDPSNAKEKYARGRLRKIAPLLEKEGLSVGSLSLLAQRAGLADEALAFYTKAFLQERAKTPPGGYVLLEREAFRSVPSEIAMRALSACLVYVNDEGHPPEFAGLSRVLSVLLSDEMATARTFYGCLIAIGKKTVTVSREPAAVAEPLMLPAKTTLLWDGRWLVSAGEVGGEIRPLGSPSHVLLDKIAPGLRKLVPQGRVRALLPSLWQEGRLVAAPSFEQADGFCVRYKSEGFAFPRKRI